MYCLFVSVFLVGGLRSFGVFLQSISWFDKCQCDIEM